MFFSEPFFLKDKYQLILIHLIKNKMQTTKKAELVQVEK